MVIEIVDAEEKIKAFLPDIDKMIGEGLASLEKVLVIAYHSIITRCEFSNRRSLSLWRLALEWSRLAPTAEEDLSEE